MSPSQTPRPLVVGLGELLWDLFPKGKQLGGAPANFAYITALLGDSGMVASRVGDDRLGQEALWHLKSSGLDVSRIQRDPTHPTGTVKVEVDLRGQPEYHISENVAWDFLEFSEDWVSLARATHAVCFGSLAQRNSVSRATIRAFLSALPSFAIGIFDVNLRQSYFSGDLLRDSARHATILKLNHEEFPRFLDLLRCPLKGSERSDIFAARWLCRELGIRLVCITRGPAGSALITAESHHEHPGFSVKIADTVGAGDAFTAALVHHALRGSSLAAMNVAANRMGAWVASQEGAMPAADPEILAEVRAA
ncbi:MAG: carbohydrate kinase [Acidobacteria bacterium]|nr:MAG: carbohydrate kinase [Acidobacteriota bacterium]